MPVRGEFSRFVMSADSALAAFDAAKFTRELAEQGCSGGVLSRGEVVGLVHCSSIVLGEAEKDDERLDGLLFPMNESSNKTHTWVDGTISHSTSDMELLSQTVCKYQS